jgi:tetratricopeptide (TPR) repeat protein
MGVALRQLGQHSEAVDAFGKAAADDEKVFADRAQSLYLRGKIQLDELYEAGDALSSFERALQLDPENTDLRAQVCRCYLELGRTEEAKTALRAIDDPNVVEWGREDGKTVAYLKLKDRFCKILFKD